MGLVSLTGPVPVMSATQVQIAQLSAREPRSVPENGRSLMGPYQEERQSSARRMACATRRLRASAPQAIGEHPVLKNVLGELRTHAPDMEPATTEMARAPVTPAMQEKNVNWNVMEALQTPAMGMGGVWRRTRLACAKMDTSIRPAKRHALEVSGTSSAVDMETVAPLVSALVMTDIMGQIAHRNAQEDIFMHAQARVGVVPMARVVATMDQWARNVNEAALVAPHHAPVMADATRVVRVSVMRDM